MHALSQTTLCDLHGLWPTRLLCPRNFPGKNTEWVAIAYSRGSSWLRDQSCISCVSYIGRRIPYHCTIWETPSNLCIYHLLCTMYLSNLYIIYYQSCICLICYIIYYLIHLSIIVHSKYQLMAFVKYNLDLEFSNINLALLTYYCKWTHSSFRLFYSNWVYPVQDGLGGSTMEDFLEKNICIVSVETEKIMNWQIEQY